MSPLSRLFLTAACACAVVAPIAADIPEAVETDREALAPIVITNEDLPDKLSVSVLGPLVVEESPGGLPDMSEIERLASLNETARTQAERRRPQPEPEAREIVVWRDWYPYALFNTRCGFGLHCSKYPYPWGRGRARDADAPPHGRRALPAPREGFAGRPGPHLERSGPPRQSIRGRDIRSHSPPNSRTRVNGAGGGRR